MGSILVRFAFGFLGFSALIISWNVAHLMIQDFGASIAPIQQSELTEDRIYAYRHWQSVGIRVEKYDFIDVRATGKWLYTPGEYHGPEGHPHFYAPPFYPAPGPSGALIGRVGEEGEAFFIGRGMGFPAGRDGLLYLSINDDVLSDNDGYMVVEVAVTEAE